jgi:hypothetical protein
MDNELRDALQRVDPPAGFAERVMAKTKAAGDPPSLATPAHPGHAPLVRWALAAALLLAVSGGAWYRTETRRREGEEARRQVLASLNIAGSKLRAVQMKINHEQER